MEFLLLIVHILVAATVVGLVLLQHGKGADMGAAFGSGSSGSLFGASGSANFMSRATAALATVFFLTSMGLTYFAGQKHETGNHGTDTNRQTHQNEHQNRKIIFEHVNPEMHAAVMPKRRRV